MNHRFVDLTRSRGWVPRGIGSRTLLQKEGCKMVLFHFDTGQQLSEHTASRPAVMHFLEGEARVLLGKRWRKVKEGAWIHMDAGLPHAIEAKTRVVMLLTLLPS